MPQKINKILHVGFALGFAYPLACFPVVVVFAVAPGKWEGEEERANTHSKILDRKKGSY